MKSKGRLDSEKKDWKLYICGGTGRYHESLYGIEFTFIIVV